MFRVAIVGRPNVGKSTLFNKLARSRKAIVGNEPGITRDRLYSTVDWDGKVFEVIDTGGIVPEDSERIPEQIFRQAEIALQEADLIVWVVDGREGVTPIDQTLNSLLRAGGKDFLLAVNKIDADGLESLAAQFYALGVEKLFPVSAEHSLGLDELLDEVLRRVPEGEPEEAESEIRVAVIGRPNMGKSSLVNRFLGEERVIVTEIPGTTRDAIDSVLVHQGRRYRLVDTAGIRRKGKTELMADKLSVVMARKSIQRADVVLLVIDAVEGAAKTDATIGGYADEAGKSLIIVVNKWDLVERDTHTAAKLEKEFRMRMRFLQYAPLVFVSAKTGLRVFKLLEHVDKAFEARRLRVPTGELNKFVETEVQPIVQSRHASRKFPVMYAAQVATSPPTFVFFTRTRDRLHYSTIRFLSNRLREKYGFYATPIRIVQRVRGK